MLVVYSPQELVVRVSISSVGAAVSWLFIIIIKEETYFSVHQVAAGEEERSSDREMAEAVMRESDRGEGRTEVKLCVKLIENL
nr:hypothetical protein Iba_chr01cCG4450 [Ipomoea batatas]